MLTAAISSPDGEARADAFDAVLADQPPFTVEVRKGLTLREFGQTIADEFLARERDLIAAFCAAFAELAEVHDSGASTTAQQVLQELGTFWAQSDG